MQTPLGKSGWLALALLGVSGAAQAHTPGLPPVDFVTDLAHSCSGLNHILAMVAVGLRYWRSAGGPARLADAVIADRRCSDCRQRRLAAAA